MQKQFKFKANIKYHAVSLNDDFPILHFKYVQKHKDFTRLHYHDAFEIGLCLKGGGLFFIDDKVVSFKKGDVSFIFPNQPHIAQSPDDLPSIWYFITMAPDRLFSEGNTFLYELVSSRGKIPGILPQSEYEDISVIVGMIIHELEKKENNYEQAIRSLLMVFMLQLLRSKNEAIQNNSILSNNFAAVSPVLDYISAHYPEDITIKKMAQLCHLSVSHFRVVFKKATKFSPLRYLTYIRMKMAKTLLASTKLSVITISQKVGYESISSFNRAFKEQYKITPTEYRKEREHI